MSTATKFKKSKFVLAMSLAIVECSNTSEYSTDLKFKASNIWTTARTSGYHTYTMLPLTQASVNHWACACINIHYYYLMHSYYYNNCNQLIRSTK